jgi:hypothetical protein
MYLTPIKVFSVNFGRSGFIKFLLKIFDVADKTFAGFRNVSAGSGPLRGVANYDGTLLTGESQLLL